MRVSPKLTTIIFALLLSALPLISNAQPGYHPGYHWSDRARAYSALYCSASNASSANPEYGYYAGTDCANFTSQLNQGGCSGLGEANRNNFSGWNQGTGVCWDYYSSDPETNTAHGCVPSYITFVNHGTGNHRIVPAALDQSWWYWCSDSMFINWDVEITGPYDLPNWVEPGTFIVFKWNNGTWHMTYVVSGTSAAGNVMLAAHSNPHCELSSQGASPISFSNMYTFGHSSGTAWAEAYKSQIFSIDKEH